jgi:hypothetical protein
MVVKNLCQEKPLDYQTRVSDLDAKEKDLQTRSEPLAQFGLLVP